MASELLVSGATVTPKESSWCRPSVWIVECVWEGSKCTSDDMIFIEEGDSPLNSFFSPPHDSRQGVLWSPVDFFFIIQLYLQFVCVHEGRRFHSAITAPNDHVELDNDQLWRWVGNNCGTPAFYRCASVFCNSPQKKEK